MIKKFKIVSMLMFALAITCAFAMAEGKKTKHKVNTKISARTCRAAALKVAKQEAWKDARRSFADNKAQMQKEKEDCRKKGGTHDEVALCIDGVFQAEFYRPNFEEISQENDSDKNQWSVNYNQYEECLVSYTVLTWQSDDGCSAKVDDSEQDCG